MKAASYVTVVCRCHPPEAGEFYSWASWVCCVREDSCQGLLLIWPVASGDGCSPPLSYANQRFHHHAPKTSPPLLGRRAYKPSLSKWVSGLWWAPARLSQRRFSAQLQGLAFLYSLLPKLYILFLRTEISGQYLISSSVIRKHILGERGGFGAHRRAVLSLHSFLQWAKPFHDFNNVWAINHFSLSHSWKMREIWG